MWAIRGRAGRSECVRDDGVCVIDMLSSTNERGLEKERGDQYGDNVSDDLWEVEDARDGIA